LRSAPSRKQNDEEDEMVYDGSEKDVYGLGEMKSAS